MINLKVIDNILKNFDGTINIIDDKECVNGIFADRNIYENLQVNLYTVDINANRLSDNPNIISEPWFLIYNFSTSEKFDCTYNWSYEFVQNKFISLISNTKSEVKNHRTRLIEFIELYDIDCCYSNLDQNKTLTEISEHYPNGYYKNNFDYGVPKEYFESCIDIVTESLASFSTHFSEKTYKPLFYKKPFISIAGPYYYETLKEYGFELYDELFDYTFDIEEDEIVRTNDIMIQLKKLNAMSLKEVKDICRSIQPKIDHNYETVMKQKPNFIGLTEKIVVLGVERKGAWKKF